MQCQVSLRKTTFTWLNCVWFQRWTFVIQSSTHNMLDQNNRHFYKCERGYMQASSLWWIIHTVPPQPVLLHLNITHWRESWQLETAGWWSNVDPKRLQGLPSLGAKTLSWFPTQLGENSLNEIANIICLLICKYCMVILYIHSERLVYHFI